MMKICDFVGINYDYNISPEYLPVPLDVVEQFLRRKDTNYRYECFLFFFKSINS